MNGIDRVYKMLEEEQKELQQFYKVLKPSTLFDTNIIELEALIEDFLDFIGLSKNSETLLAAVNRIVNLREDTLLNIIRDFDEERKIAVKEKAFVWVSRFYIQRFEKLLEKIEKEKLLSPFYVELLKGAHNIGMVFSSWQSSWMAQIIYGVNRELFRLFNGDEEKIFEMLQNEGLLDLGHNAQVGDRCYSVLKINEDGSFNRLCYAEAFENEVRAAAKEIDILVSKLKNLEDEYKDEWIEYFIKIKDALLEKEPDSAILRWADVDRAWMKIKSPIQIGHPLEYYEDHYRKAVALEWDVRVANPFYTPKDFQNRIKSMFKRIYFELGINSEEIFLSSLNNIEKTQLYVGRPFSFYGSEFNGLFSAQVVPNDEVVSKEFGKKIFAYADMVYENQKVKPLMKIHSAVYGKELAKHFRRVLENKDIWVKVYEITTIGHEYGHILWMDNQSEIVMNQSGQFKNLEEFKATLGGLVSFFFFEDERLWEYILEDTITRAVSLISWMEVGEVLPYYIEGLLHLEGLFRAGILRFEDRLYVNLDRKSYEKLKTWYIDIYKEIAANYLYKRDSKEFLGKFIYKDGKSYYPKSEDVNIFVKYYYNLYKKIGNKIDE